jgi:hypothetical protein
MSEDNLEESTVVETVVTEPEPDSETVLAARRMGWRPLDEYHGDKSRWVDAETFVRRGETELPIVRERYRALEKKFVDVEKRLEESSTRLNETVKVLNEVRELGRSAEERGFERASRELAERERKAVAEADIGVYDAIQREKAALVEGRPKIVSTPPKEPEPRTTPPAAPPATNPTIDAWIADNPWFNSDPLLHSVAIGFDSQLQTEAPGMGMSDRLAEVKKQVMARFPEKFGNPARRAPPTVTTTSMAAPRSTKKTIKDLPRDAQEAFARFKKAMPTYTEEEYMQAYGDMT